jgi:AcrR family transcriptional regulator
MAEDGVKRVDLRISRTHASLWEAMVALIDERGYTAITVRDIALRAMVNRATFYRYYEDKDDLFRQGCVRVIDSIIGKVLASQRFEGEIGIEWIPSYLEGIFKFVEEERETLRILNGPGSNPEFRLIIADKIEATIENERLARWDPAFKIIDDPLLAEVYACSIAALLIRTITWWLSKDEPISIERVGEVYRTIVIGALKELLGGRGVALYQSKEGPR